MKVATAPPPSKDSTASASGTAEPSPSPSPSSSAETAIGPPPPKAPNPPNPQSVKDLTQTHRVPETPPLQSGAKPPQNQTQSLSVPYTIPPWSEPPRRPFFLEVLKEGSIIDQFNVSEKGAYMFGRVDLCDFILEHPTISRYHAVLQFKGNGQAYIYDLGSTHGTFVNKSQVKKKAYVELHVGAIIRFGQSSRLYVFQGPSDLMPPEADLERIRNAKLRQEMQDREASLLRAKREASVAEGISWGMGEDAIEENEDNVDDLTWQTYKGQLTEKQEKTREKVLKRYEKIAHMKKEIDAIRAKDIAQGGLTQGQQTQIARNEQRTSQIMEELENLEETLNESIRESLGARSRGNNHGKRVATEDDEEFLSDDDEFYDRTKKQPSKRKGGETQSVETADSLLDKKEAVIKQMEDKKQLLLVENAVELKTGGEDAEAGDALDTYMCGLSSQLVLDKTAELQKEMSALQSELDRIEYLLKIADPLGEAAKKRDSRVRGNKNNEHRHRCGEPQIHETLTSQDSVLAQPKCKMSESSADVRKHPPTEHEGVSVTKKDGSGSTEKHETLGAKSGSGKSPEADMIAAEGIESKPTMYTVEKPQWLGAIDTLKKGESLQQEPLTSMQEEGHQFVDYKDRKKILGDEDKALAKADVAIANAAPGLIIRKRKHIEKSEPRDDQSTENSEVSSSRAQTTAEDAVALLLKHSRGFHLSDDDVGNETLGIPGEPHCQSNKITRALGPERPFLDNSSDYESWVPPEGQSGDGRTSLNERYGY